MMALTGLPGRTNRQNHTGEIPQENSSPDPGFDYQRMVDRAIKTRRTPRQADTPASTSPSASGICRPVAQSRIIGFGPSGIVQPKAAEPMQAERLIEECQRAVALTDEQAVAHIDLIRLGQPATEDIRGILLQAMQDHLLPAIRAAAHDLFAKMGFGDPVEHFQEAAALGHDGSLVELARLGNNPKDDLEKLSRSESVPSRVVAFCELVKQNIGDVAQHRNQAIALLSRYAPKSQFERCWAELCLGLIGHGDPAAHFAAANSQLAQPSTRARAQLELARLTQDTGSKIALLQQVLQEKLASRMVHCEAHLELAELGQGDVADHLRQADHPCARPETRAKAQREAEWQEFPNRGFSSAER